MPPLAAIGGLWQGIEMLRGNVTELTTPLGFLLGKTGLAEKLPAWVDDLLVPDLPGRREVRTIMIDPNTSHIIELGVGLDGYSLQVADNGSLSLYSARTADGIELDIKNNAVIGEKGFVEKYVNETIAAVTAGVIAIATTIFTLGEALPVWIIAADAAINAAFAGSAAFAGMSYLEQGEYAFLGEAVA